jgi:hypothetical protein
VSSWRVVNRKMVAMSVRGRAASEVLAVRVTET